MIRLEIKKNLPRSNESGHSPPENGFGSMFPYGRDATEVVSQLPVVYLLGEKSGKRTYKLPIVDGARRSGEFTLWTSTVLHDHETTPTGGCCNEADADASLVRKPSSIRSIMRLNRRSEINHASVILLMQKFSHKNGTMSEHDPVSFQLAGAWSANVPPRVPCDEVIPHKHQWALHDALTDRLPGLFVDDAPTEPVKRWHGSLPAVPEGLQTVAAYPTNALIEDQVRISTRNSKMLREE